MRGVKERENKCGRSEGWSMAGAERGRVRVVRGIVGGLPRVRMRAKICVSMSYKTNHQTCYHGNILTSTSHIALELVASVFFERPEVRRKT